MFNILVIFIILGIILLHHYFNCETFLGGVTTTLSAAFNKAAQPKKKRREDIAPDEELEKKVAPDEELEKKVAPDEDTEKDAEENKPSTAVTTKEPFATSRHWIPTPNQKQSQFLQESPRPDDIPSPADPLPYQPWRGSCRTCSLIA